MARSGSLVDGKYDTVVSGGGVNDNSMSTSKILSVCTGDFSQNTDDFNLSRFGSLMGNAYRLNILRALKGCPKPVVGFSEQIGLSPHHCRHHLAVLVRHGLVASKEMKVVGVTREKNQMVFGLSVLGERVLNAYDLEAKK